MTLLSALLHQRKKMLIAAVMNRILARCPAQSSADALRNSTPPKIPFDTYHLFMECAVVNRPGIDIFILI